MDQKQKPRRLLSISDATIYTAMSRATLYNEAKEGRLKITKLGHASRIEVSELDRWIDTIAALTPETSANAG